MIDKIFRHIWEMASGRLSHRLSYLIYPDDSTWVMSESESQRQSHLSAYLEDSAKKKAEKQ